jgi:hypothetical protein
MIKKGLIAALIALGIITAGAFIQVAVKNYYGPKEASIYSVITCPEDLDSYKAVEDKGQIVHFFSEPQKSYAVNGSFDNANGFKTVVTKVDTSKSKVACGYIYIKAHTTNGGLAQYEDLYINPDNFGGHLDKSTNFGPGDGNNFSEYYFSLSDIKYWERKDRREVLEADWASLFNVSSKVTFKVALNTQDIGGTIDDIAIAYKCKDPKTGLENTGCKLTVESQPEEISF